MEEELKFYVDLEENEVSNYICNSLREYNESIIGKLDFNPFVLYVKRDSHIIGGVKGEISGNLCRVMVAWVHEDYRRQGLGTKLFMKLDEFAKRQHCKLIQLDTAEFQAKGFYEKIGYELIATLPENFMGYTTYILRKKLG